MGTRVEGKCSKCSSNFTYIFGFIPELMPIQTFLSHYVKDQKDFFVKEHFDNLIKENLKNDAEYQAESVESKKEISEKVYKYINDFFKPDEIEKLKSKILITFEIEIYPFVNIFEASNNRKVFNLPLVKLNFLDGEKYLRVYEQLRYITFTDDRKYLLCPVDLENIVKLESENKI